MSADERQIGICGTFDLENYGDLLFPLIADVELQKRLGPITLQCFSYWEKTTPDWYYPVSSLTKLPAMAHQLTGLLIGGGDLIRFDKGIAPGYVPPTPSLHLPGGYWLTPALIALQHGCPVIWNAPGAYGEVPVWAEPLMKLAIQLSEYVAVRNTTSQQTLKQFAPNQEIKVVPDTAFGAAQLVNLKEPSVEYLSLCASIGLKSPYIIIQATTGLDIFLRFVQEHLEIFQNYQFLILPIGPVLGDDPAILANQLPRSIIPPIWPGPLLLTELIGQASASIGVSLHLAIVSLAFGVPVFRPAGNLYSKYTILANFETVVTFDKIEHDPNHFATLLEKTQPESAMQDINRQLSMHWDEVASALATGRTKVAAQETINHFWESMPGLLEDSETRYHQTQKEVGERKEEVSKLKEELNALVEEQNRVIKEYESLIAKYAAEQEAIYNSNSWKITYPLRALKHKLKAIKPTNGDNNDQAT